MPLTDYRNRRFNKNNANYDKISDYFNRIVSRQNHIKAERAKHVDINDSLNRNRNLNERTEFVDKNKNQNQNFNDYFSRYVSQLNNSRNNIDSNKPRGKVDVSINEHTDSYSNTNINDRSIETKTEITKSEASDKSPNDINGFDEENASDALLDRHLLRVMLPIKVTQQMCPDSHLIAYFYHNGEFVSASKHFEMDDCFVNKVSTTFITFITTERFCASEATLRRGPGYKSRSTIMKALEWPNKSLGHIRAYHILCVL